MNRKKSIWLGWMVSVFFAALLFLAPSTGYCDLDDDTAAVVAGGQQFLFNNFNDNGDGTGTYGNNGGNDGYVPATAAAVSALIETGKYSDPAYAVQIDKAVAYLKAQLQGGGYYGTDSHYTYNTGITLVALSEYYDAKQKINPAFGDQNPAFVDTYIQLPVDYLLDGQYSSGGWTYETCSPNCDYDSGGDLSNTQFAIMGLWYAYHFVLVEDIPLVTAERLEAFVWGTQQASGTFTYTIGSNSVPYGPMCGGGLWTLGMLGLNADEPGIQNAIDWFDDHYSWVYNTSTWGSAYYYGIYAMSKAFTGLIATDYIFDSATNPWVQDLKQAMVDAAVDDGDGGCYWASGDGLDPGRFISTSWVLMSLAFSDPGTESPKKILPEPEDPDFPIQGQGFVILEAAEAGVTISDATRGNISQWVTLSSIVLPIGAYDFTMNNVLPGGTTVLKLTPTREAWNKDNPNSFINADGTIKNNLNWFKVKNGEWKGQADIPIRAMPVGGPYEYIEVTLTDGGAGDADGIADGTIVDPGAPGFFNEIAMELSLSAGWNLISLPLQPTDHNIADVLASIVDNFTSVWAYGNNGWESFDPADAGMSEFDTMDAGIGYWINMKTADNLDLRGLPPEVKSTVLIAGWNLVGYNSLNPMAIDDALASIDRKYASVWAYANGTWMFYDPAYPGFSNLTEMEPGAGFWINASEACTWTLP